MGSTSESEVRSWLETALAKENLESFSFQVTGNTEKGSGFMGDVLFVDVVGTTKQGSTKEYNLVLKCNKLIDKSVFRDAFVREIHVYDKIFPFFEEFQRKKGIKIPFASVPKYYGAYSDQSRYIIVMENLSKSGYGLYNNKRPLTRKHINLVVKEYAKFHAISVAVKEQEPENYQKLIQSLNSNLFDVFFEESNFESILLKNLEYACEMLKNDINEDTFNKWLSYKDKTRFICSKMVPDATDLQVITHGDCWSNNFMYKYQDDEQSIVSNVTILDWQIVKTSSPVWDLSYFLFACIAPPDVAELNIILKEYYLTFSHYLTELGSSFAKTYSFEKFFEEWKKYAKFGVIMCTMPIKMAYVDKDDIPDMSESAKKGEDIGTGFNFDVKNKDEYKNRLRPIIEYAAETGIL